MKYVYLAKMTDDDGHVMIEFPDLPNCFSEGESLADAMEEGRDALETVLADMEDRGQAIPLPSKTIHCDAGETTALVMADTLAYRRRTSAKAIKKTLTIPAWLDTAAEKHGVNYSKLLQESLIAHLHMDGESGRL